jgi:hypothetical protein
MDCPQSNRKPKKELELDLFLFVFVSQQFFDKENETRKIYCPINFKRRKKGAIVILSFFSDASSCDEEDQGCQMVCFQTKNPNLDKFCRASGWKMLICFMAIWNILWPFGIFMTIWYNLC